MKIFLNLLFAFFALACTNPAPAPAKLLPEASSGLRSAPSATAKLPPEASSGLRSAPTATDPIPFPVFLTFNEFEPYLHRSNDTTYVINFWATWCKPCVEEMPYFEKLIREYSGQPVKVYLVSMDFPKDIEKKLIPFVQERQITHHVIALADMDYDAWIDKVSSDWDGAIPFTLVYNKNNRQAKMGEMDSYDELEQLVKATLK
jgi:thiol-disulfide isomerase/thioredoxin